MSVLTIDLELGFRKWPKIWVDSCPLMHYTLLPSVDSKPAVTISAGESCSEMGESQDDMKLYRTWKVCLTRVLHTQKVYVTGLHHVPKIGGGLLASNHINWKDVLFIATRAPRPIHYVATNELFDVDLCARMFYQYAQETLGPKLALLTKKMCSSLAQRIVPGVKKIGTIPTTRKHFDRHLYSQLKQTLCEGKLVCIFAEAGTSTPGKIRKFTKTAAKVSYDLYTEGFTDIPVVPTLVMGTDKFFLPARRLGLHFGTPLYIRDQILKDGKQTIVRFTQVLEDSVRHLLNTCYSPA